MTDDHDNTERGRRIAEAIDRFARLLDSIEWIGAGDSVRHDERAELERLIERYPDVVDCYLQRRADGRRCDGSGRTC